MKRPWTEWREPAATPQFSIERANANAEYLEVVLGQDWIYSGFESSSPHLVHAWWRSGGSDAFMTLNALAENLRTLTVVPGLADALHDLRQVNGYKPTFHVLHMAAMMARGGAKILKLFEPSNDSVPDFEVEISGETVAVEAKQLTESEPSLKFRPYAMSIMQRLAEEICLPGRNYPVITVVIKNAEQLPEYDAIRSLVLEGLCRYKQGVGVHRSRFVNVFLDPYPGVEAFADFHSFHIVCPKSRKENTRIARRAEKSNKQLHHHNKDVQAGLLLMGLTEHQDPHEVAQVLVGKFKGGQLRRLSGVVLHAPAGQRGPGMRYFVDMVGVVANPGALVAPPTNIPIKPLGVALNIFQHAPPSDEVSTYRVGEVSGRVLKGGAILGLSERRHLTTAMIM